MISPNAAKLVELQGIQIIFKYQSQLKLNDTELACELGISEHSIKCYKLNTKNKRHPSESVIKLAKLKLRLWELGITVNEYELVTE
ncbi:hypothetical protein [Planktothrix agardhii]|uniref:hypothetical protein n=1 Tax=Planktothrix agardhii TaxID=1160 RepID=UPI0020B28C08|nr:hypothetical protein [Planktothrix agardhii]